MHCSDEVWRFFIDAMGTSRHNDLDSNFVLLARLNCRFRCDRVEYGFK